MGVASSQRATISTTEAVLIIIGIVVGPGIFETASAVARSLPSEASLLLMWIVGGTLSLCGVLCYAELSGRYPENGGEYVWLRESFGRRFADLFLWSDIAIVRPGAIAAMAFPAARYLKAIVPAVQCSDPTLAAVIVALFTLVNILGFYVGKCTQNILTILTLAALIFIIGLGLYSVPALPPHSLTPDVVNHSPNYGLALILILFAFGGWNEIANVTADMVDRAHGLYRASVVSLFVITVLYVIFQFVFVELLGFAHYAASELPVITGLKTIFPQGAVAIVYGVICLSCLGTIQGMIFTGARLYRYVPVWSLAPGDPFSPRQLGLSYTIQGILSLVIVLMTTSFMDAVVYTTAVAWTFFVLKGLAVVMLRHKHGIPSTLAVPWYPWPVIIFCGSSAYLTYAAVVYSPIGSAISLVIVLLGLLIAPFASLVSRKRHELPPS